MKLVVDSNIFFTFFWKNSAFEDVLGKKPALSSPIFALDELSKHSREMMEKSKLPKKEFETRMEELKLKVGFVPLSEYSSFITPAKSFASHLPDREKEEIFEDIDFLALSIKLGCPLWSNDKLLKKQTGVPVISTKELITLLESQ